MLDACKCLIEVPPFSRDVRFEGRTPLLDKTTLVAAGREHAKGILGFQPPAVVRHFRSGLVEHELTVCADLHPEVHVDVLGRKQSLVHPTDGVPCRCAHEERVAAAIVHALP